MTVSNSGTILSPSNYAAVALYNGGTVTNTGGAALIKAGTTGGAIDFGVEVYNAAGVITNTGTILAIAGVAAVDLMAGGTVTNAALTGLIGDATGQIGVLVSGSGGTVVNAGTITGSVDAISFNGTSGASNLLVNDPGAVFSGAVSAPGTDSNTLDLAVGSGASGTLTGLGTQFTGFQTLEIDSAASWRFSGANTLANGGVLFNSGTGLVANTLDISGAVQGSGTLVITSAATLQIRGTIASGAAIDFTGIHDVLRLGSTAGLSGTLFGLAGTDTIDLASLSSAGATVTLESGDTLLVNSGGTSVALALGTGGSYTHDVFTPSSDGASGTDIVVSMATSTATATWLTAQSGTFSVGSNWTGGLVPTNTALFETGTLSPYTVTGTSAASATVATIDVGDIVTFAGSIDATTIVDVGDFNAQTGTLTIGGLLTTPTVDLTTAGAALTLSAGGTLVGGAAASVVATIVNAGSVTNTATSGAGIYLQAGGVVTNSATSALIYGTFDGVRLVVSGTLLNSGTVSGNNGHQGIELDGGGTVVNTGTGALINAASDGVAVSFINAPGTVINTGTIRGDRHGVVLNSGGTIINSGIASAILGVTSVGIVLDAGTPGVITNAGTISGSYGIVSYCGGTISNTGTIVSPNAAIKMTGGGTLINDGTLSGSVAVKFLGTSGVSNLLVVDPGAVFVGSVLGTSTAQNTLDLASSVNSGTLTSLGTQFTGFQTLEIDSGAKWLFSGANNLASGGTLINSGTATIANTLDITGAVMGSGTLVVASGATLEIGGALAATQTIDFTGANGVAQFGATAGLSGILSGLVAGDTIDLSSLASAGATATLESGNTLLVNSGATSVTLTLDPSGSYTSDVLTPSSDGASGTDIVVSMATSTPTATWLTAQNGVFSVGSFWTGGLVPSNTALFETGTLSPYTVTGTSSASATIATIDVGDIVTFAGTIGATGIVNVGTFGARTGTLTVGGLVTSPTVDLTTAGAALTVSVGGTLQANTYSKTAATVTNSGTITGSGKAILLNGGGLVTNATTTSSIYGSGYLAAVTVGFSGSVINLGTISTKSGDQGIDLENGGIVNNVGSTALISATMESGADAIIAYTSAGTITNAGTIQGRDRGISLEHGGTVTNTGPTSLILAGNDQADTGIEIFSIDGTVTNAGTVAGSFGINLSSGGTITNSGTIAGSQIAVYTYGGATVINSGSIIGIGTPDALDLGGDSGAANLLIVDPGAVFVGYVVGATTMRNTLDLAAGVNSGTISSLGTQFIGFQTLEIDSGATWRFGGANTLASGGTLINSGTATIANTLDITGAVQGSGTLVVASGATLEIGGALAAAQTIDFTGANEVAQFGTTAGLSGVLSGLVAGDTIDLSSLASAGATATLVSGNRLLVKSGATSVTLSLDPSGTYTNDLLAPSSDGTSGTDIVISAATSTPTATWLTAQNGIFSVGSFWTGGLVPTNTALFETGTLSPYTVTGTSSASATIATIDVRDIVTFAGTIGATGSVDIGAFNSQIGTLIVAGALTTPTIDLTSAGASLDVTGSLSGGVVATANDTVATTGTAALINTGTSGTAIGVYGGPAGVSNAGTIEGGSRGVVLNFGGSITNSGSIVSDGSGGGGVIGYDGGTVTNVGTLSSISGTVAGIHLEGAAGAITNAGAIGGGLFGIDLSANGTVSNSGTIVATEAGGFGIGASAGGTIVNTGTVSGITGVNDGVYVRGGTGIITNAGTIQGGTFGVDLVGGGTLTDSGVISGATAIAFGGNGANVLTLDGTARVSGSVTGSAAAQNTLDLAAATGAGTIASLGTQYTGFQTLEIDPSAQWSFTGANTLASGGTLINSGTGIVANTLDITGAVRGSGTLIVASAATLEIGGALGAGQTIDFTGANDLVRFGTTSGLSGTLSGLALGDTIDLSALAYGGGATATIDTGAHTLTVTTTSGTVTLALDPATAYGNAVAVTSQDSGTGTDIVLSGSTIFSWASADPGIFSFGANWLGGAAPNGTLDTALFETGSPTAYTVTGTSAASADVGTIDIGDLVTFAGTIGATSIVNVGGFGAQTGTLTIGGLLATPTVDLTTAGAALNVSAGGTLSGGAVAAIATTIANAGGIVNASGNGIALNAGGLVTNTTTAASIYGSAIGVQIGSTGTILNAGTIASGNGTEQAIELNAGGTIINIGSAALIAGGFTGNAIDVVNGPGVITNAGTIRGGHYGIYLHDGGTITNTASSASIYGGVSHAILIASNGTVINSGTISSSGEVDQLIELNNGGAVTNSESGNLLAPGTDAVAVDIGVGSGTITNAGTIQSGQTGIFLGDGGTVTNSGSASLIAATNNPVGFGIKTQSLPGVVANAGTVAGVFGVSLQGGGTVTNTGTIVGSHVGVYTNGGGTVINAGSIVGAGNALAVDFGGTNGATDLLIVDPGAVFVGDVVASGAMRNTLDLASGTGVGMISSLGSRFEGFQTLRIDSGATWLFTGANSLAVGGTLINSGTGSIANALDITGAVLGSGTLVIASAATLAIGGALAAGQTIDFNGTNAVAQFGTTAGLSGILSGLTATDTIDLAALSSSGATATLANTNTLLVASGNTRVALTLDPATGYGTDRFVTSGDGASGTVITLVNEVPPTAVSDSYTAAENGVLTVPAASGVLANDVDPNANTTLSVALVSGPSFGSVTLNADGSFTYAPNAGFVGFDSFTYDDSDGFDTSTPATVSIDVSFLAQPSMISGTVAGQATNDETPITPFSGVTITDSNSGGAITSGFDSAPTETVTIAPSTTANGTLSDPNAATDGGVISNGTFNIAGTASAVTAAIDALVFTPVAHEVAPGSSVTTGFTLTDVNSAGQTATDTTTSVVATAVSDTPAIAGTVGGQTVSDEGSLSPFSGVMITDPDFGAQETITLTLSAAANGTLSGNGLSLVAPGTYTLAAGAPSAVSAALDAVAFTPTAHQVAPGGSVTTGITLTDTDNHATSATDTTISITATAADDTPSFSGVSGSQSVTGDGTITPFATTAIIDPDDGARESVTITLTDGGVATDADGTLAGAGLTRTGVGTYTLAAGSPAAVNTELAALTFTSTLAPDTSATTVLSLSDSDSHGTANAVAVTVVGSDAAAAPAISAVATGQPGLDTTPVDPFSGVTITDTNGIGQTETVTVTPSGTVNGVFSDSVGGAVSGAGVYSVSGSAAAVSAALDALTFTPTRHQVAPGQTVSTSFALAVTDTAGQSASATASVIVTAVNDPPAVTVPNAAPSVQNQVSYPVFPGVSISDPDTGQTETATVTLGAAIGTLSDASGTVAPGGQSYSVSGSPAAVAAALRRLVFTPSQGIGEPGTTLTATATLAVSDGIATTNSTVTLAAPQSSAPFAYLDNVAAGAGGTVTVTIGLLTAVAGTFYGLGIGTLSADDSTYTVAGPTDAVDAALAGVLFTPATPSSNRTPAVRAALSGGVTFNGDPQAVLSTGAAAATLVGGAGSVTIQAGAGGGVFVGGTSGQNMLGALAAGTTLLGGGTADTLVAAASGGDVLVAGAGGETLNGGASASGNVLFGAGSGATSIAGGAGHDTVVAQGGSTTIAGGTGGSLIYLGGGTNVVRSQAADTIVGAAGSDSITAGGAGDLVFTGAASTLFIGGSAASTVVGGAGSLTVFGGAGGGVFLGGGAGGNVLSANAGAATLVGGGSGDVLTAANAASDALVAGAGNETLNAAGGSGAVAVFGGSGADQVVLGAGSDIFVAGGGSAAVAAGTGTDVFTFLAGGAGSTTISGFVAGTDKVLLVGYAPGAAAAAMRGLTFSGGNSSVTLSDGTRITFAGVTALPGGTFG